MQQRDGAIESLGNGLVARCGEVDGAKPFWCRERRMRVLLRSHRVGGKREYDHSHEGAPYPLAGYGHNSKKYRSAHLFSLPP
jgi:hypothetical protein